MREAKERVETEERLQQEQASSKDPSAAGADGKSDKLNEVSTGAGKAAEKVLRI